MPTQAQPDTSCGSSGRGAQEIIPVITGEDWTGSDPARCWPVSHHAPRDTRWSEALVLQLVAHKLRLS